LLAKRNGRGVMVREGNVLATSFHPELTDDPRVHQYFLDMVIEGSRAA
jgi:5'-phosphate synthase pdxT subunit